MARSNAKIKAAIQSVIKEMMDRVMNNVLVTDRFSTDKHRAQRPLYAALVPDEIFKGSHFERRFVTPFGLAWQKLAVVAAKNGLGESLTDHSVVGTVKTERLRRIGVVLNSLEHPEKDKRKVKPDWDAELAYILEGKGKDIPVSVVCDVYAVNRKSSKRYAFELKSPLPNSDITKVSKEKLLKLYSMEPRQVDEAYFALPYNPFGTRANYDWTFPARWFDMRKDKVVLIGNEFWDKIGGSGTYQAFIEAVNEIGPEYKDRIYREFLEIEPPSHTHNDKL